MYKMSWKGKEKVGKVWVLVAVGKSVKEKEHSRAQTKFFT